MQAALSSAIEPMLEVCLLRSARLGVKTSNESRGTAKVTLSLHSSSLGLLNDAKTDLNAALVYSEVVNSNKYLLFSVGARHSMQTLSAKEAQLPVSDRFYMYWDRAASRVLVYGAAAQRERGLGELDALVDQIKERMVTRILYVRSASRCDVKASLPQLKQLSKVEELILHGYKLHLFGDASAADKLESLLEGKFDKEERKIVGGIQQQDCCVCYCELDAEFYELLDGLRAQGLQGMLGTPVSWRRDRRYRNAVAREVSYLQAERTVGATRHHRHCL